MKMYALIRYERSNEGGPEVEFVCGIFEECSDIIKSKALKLTLENLNPDEFAGLEYVRVSGKFIVQVSWENHGVQQNEFVDSYKTLEEAEKCVKNIKSSGEHYYDTADESSHHYITKYEIGKLKCW